MRAVMTRVKHASVTIDGKETRSIGEGFLILLGGIRKHHKQMPPSSFLSPMLQYPSGIVLQPPPQAAHIS